MNILVLNSGSSSVKFQVVATDLERIQSNADQKLAQGTIERIGGEAVITMRVVGRPPHRSTAPVRDHRAAVDLILRWLTSEESQIPGITRAGDIHAAGHRVVHGGEHFRDSVRINPEVLERIEECMELAPLHNHANLKGIRAVQDLLGAGLPQVAVFDTAFHQSLPEKAYLYGIPYQLYRRHRIRRYGFHGTSYRFVTFRYCQVNGLDRSQANIIATHLGNGCSIAAIEGGYSVDTSMGFTPLEGLLMGTRSGDLDPAIIEYLAAKEGMTMPEIVALLNKHSGLMGISGLTNEMRELLEEARENSDRRARLAIDIFCYRVKKYVGAFLAAMGGADALVFTGGIGENSPEIRGLICAGLEFLGIEVDPERNAAHKDGVEGIISRPSSRLAVYVIPTDEELMIARDTVRCIEGVHPL